MIIGFGFGSPVNALVMLIITGLISYAIFKYLRKPRTAEWDEKADWEEYKHKRREYYFRQREKALEMADKYNLTDEEIERLIEEELRR